MELNEIQKIKMALLVMNHADVENAQKAYDFVMADSKEPANQATPSEMADGVYIIGSNGEVISFIGNDTKLGDIKPAYIGIVEGIRSIKVALYDAAKGKDIELTTKKDTTSYSGYINNYVDAVQDWNGKENTEHLKEIGLNSKIDLKDGEYIPALAEMYLICRNRKQVNEALRFIGAEILDDLWYCTSTEYSSTHAWDLYLYDGIATNGAKATNQLRVRAVSAFSPLAAK